MSYIKPHFATPHAAIPRLSVVRLLSPIVLLWAIALCSAAHGANVTINESIDLNSGNTAPSDDISFVIGPNSSPFVNMNLGANVNSIQAYDDAVIEIVGGVISSDASVYETSLIDVHSGAVLGDLLAFDQAAMYVFGGTVGPGAIVASDSSVINLVGGNTLSDLQAHDSASIYVFGYGLAFSGTLLTGTLKDGTPFLRNTATSGNGQIVLMNVPEPSSLAILGAGMLAGAVVFCRRQRRTA